MRRDRRRKDDTMRIQLSDHFTYKKIWRFSLPPIVMMVFTSIYGVVDGLFVSNFVGKVPFAAINLVMPFIMILGGFGFMIGTGGSALVAKTIGEGDREKANRYFSMMIQLTLAAGIVLSVIGVLFIRPISYLLGATDAMIEDCVVYGRWCCCSIRRSCWQNVFQTFLAAAEKPKLGLAATVAAVSPIWRSTPCLWRDFDGGSAAPRSPPESASALVGSCRSSISCGPTAAFCASQRPGRKAGYC